MRHVAGLTRLLVLTLAALATPAHSADAHGVIPARIAFVSSRAGGMRIALVSTQGGDLRLLSRGPGAGQSPRWSPDGRRLVYVNNRTGRWQIHVLQPGRGERVLTSGGADRVFPMWSPDGRRIAYVVRRAGDEQVWIMNADGSSQRPLTRPPGRNTVPTWSPDGRMLAFISTRDAGVAELYVMRPDGTGQRRLTAPDVYVKNAFGRGEQELAPIGVLLRPGVLHPAWSPNGRTIAYVIRVGRAEQQISIVDLERHEARRLTTGYAPAWSPDGSSLAFVVARVGDAQIYVMNADGTGLRRLMAAGANMLPSWSPDGRWLAFLAAGPGGLGLYVMRPDGTGRRRLGDAAGDLSMLPVLSWQP